MTEINWKQLEADHAAGTPGPWAVPDQTWRRTLTVEAMTEEAIPCPGSGGAMSYTHDVCELAWSGSSLWDANASRIARVPDLEAYALAARTKLEAAERLAKALEDIDRSYETEYDGRMYRICTGCSAQEDQKHSPDCAWAHINEALAAWDDANREADQ